MKFKISLLGIIIFMLPMLINVVFFALPPTNEMENQSVSCKTLEFIEQGSRALYAIALCVLVSSQKIEFTSPWLIAGIFFLVLYYIVWIRYFACGRDAMLLGESFLFVPMPLAIFPVLYYLCMSLWVHNYISFGIMIIFGIAHNIISYQSLFTK